MKINKYILSDKEYRELMRIAPIITVDVLLFNKDLKKILLFKRKNDPLKNKYYSCGGRLLKNEGFTDCALRKLKEETGLKINKNNLRFNGIFNEIWPNSKFINVNYHAVNIYFLYIMKKENDISKICLDEQHSNFKWFNINNKSIHPIIKDKIKIIINNEKIE